MSYSLFLMHAMTQRRGTRRQSTRSQIMWWIKAILLTVAAYSAGMAVWSAIYLD